MSRRPAASDRLSQRDVGVLRDVARFRFATGEQLQRLHFTDGTDVGRRRRCQAVLRRLTNDGFLHRLPRRVGGHGSGSASFVYQLGFRGQRLVRPDRPSRTPHDVGHQFVEHSLAITELVVGLAELHQQGAVAELAVVLEPEVWRHYIGAHGRPLILKPDLSVSLSVGGVQRVWFVEIDRATEAPKRIRAKCCQFLEYWRTGIEQRRTGVFPKVLWSVPDDKRAVSIRRVIDGLPDPAGQMFDIATVARSPTHIAGLDGQQQ